MVSSTGQSGRHAQACNLERVVILYKSLPHYRVAFFDQLREQLWREGVPLALLHGAPHGDEAKKRDSSTLSWALQVPNRTLRIPCVPDLYWQPCMDYLHSTDLVIVEQASKLLVNYALLAKQRYGGPKVAFWGHGRNFQRHRGSMVGELIKRKVSLHPHWWFAYNTTSARAVQSLGYPTHRITVVNNAVDTAALITARTTTSPDELRNLRFRLGLHGDNVAIFCGALYPDKRLPFLIEAAHDIRRQIPDFELLILGAGQEEPTLRTQIAHLPWIHYVGPKFDIDRVPYFLLSKVLLLPGLVGLAIIDSFAFQVPLITVDLPYHSPEIEYLADGRNGVLLPRDTSPLEYSTAVASIMKDDAQLAKLRLGCVEAASIYTVEAMVDRFTRGVLHAFAA